MGEAHAKARQRLYQAEAQATLDQRVRSRQNTESMLTQQELYLGSQAQLSGTLGGGVGQAELPYAGRYELDPALSGVVGQNRFGQIEGAVGRANDLMQQAQEAARAGNMQLAEQLRSQAESAAGGFSAGEKSSIMSFISLQTDPALEAQTRLQSPLAQSVGQQVALGRAYSDPNSQESQRLYSQVVTQPVNEVRQGTQAAVGALQQSRSAALASVDQGFAQAISEITGGEMRALSEIDANFGAALQSLEVGRANSLAEINSGLNYALQAVEFQAENARRALQAGSRQVQAQTVQGLRQAGGGAARPAVAQAIAGRAQEGFATQRANTFAAQGQQEAALQASAATERAGIEQQTGLAKADIQSRQGELKSGVILSAAQQRTQVQISNAELEAQINIQTGLAEAQLKQQGALAAADLMQRGTQFTETFRMQYSMTSVQAAQAYLTNQSGVREEYQASLDSLEMLGAQFAQQQSLVALQIAEGGEGGAGEGNAAAGAAGGAVAGAQAGASFGPWGIAIGAIAGAGLGYLSSR